MKSVFLEKLIDRIDRVDPESLQTHFLHLARERGLLEMIFQAIQEGVLVVDGMGRLSYANRSAGQMLGFQPDHVVGKPVTRFMDDLDWDHILNPRSEEWSRLITREIELHYPERRVVNFYVVPLSSENTHDSGAVVILRDITKERLQEASVLQSERMNAVQLLAAGVAHEIGNPLNALNIHLQLMDRDIRALREGAAHPEQSSEWTRTILSEMSSLHELVDIARSEVSRLDLIITQFLRAIRPTQPKLEPVRIERLLEESLTLLRHEVQNRDIGIDITSPSGLPEIQVDVSQMKQVFFNVVKNAFQAMPDGGMLRIEITHDREFLCIAFRDSGVGIDPAELGRVFEPYHTTKSTGSGLGLMIVQRIVQDHGGHIEIMSKPEVGTQISLYLPYAGRRMRLPAPK
jgi:two-component system, sporulation sensor kinase E